MRVVVIGATGNVGTSLLRSLQNEPMVERVIGVARRVPGCTFHKAAFVPADIRTSDLVPIMRGADAVVHLAWSIQPSRDLEALYSTNVEGSMRVFSAVAEAGVPALIYASSVAAYSPGPKEFAIDESWPTEGIETSFYSRHKAEVERALDEFEGLYPEIRVVRMRPGLIFKSEAATGVRRLFGGPLMPGWLLGGSALPLVPADQRFRFQCLHSYDAGDAYRAAIVSDVRGAFNLAADPILDPGELAEIFDARKVRIPRALIRKACDLTWRARLQPTPPGWVDMTFEAPLLDSTRARSELRWEPIFSAREALTDLLDGLRLGSDFDTPPLSKETTAPLRLREFSTSIGTREGAGAV